MKLPQPVAHALAHSKQLADHIRQEIMTSSGSISFARFMQLSLYAPGLGYYSAGARKFGKGGDFITAPEISPLFAACVAKQCQEILASLANADILEIGAGSGIFAKDLLHTLKELNSLPKHYYILEISADLRERQQQLLQKELPDFYSKIVWLDALPVTPITGIIFANEVLDAMPVTCFEINNKMLYERSVIFENNAFHWQLTPPTTELRLAIEHIQDECALPDYFISEINLLLPAWIKSIATSLKKGVILLVDYGYDRNEYYRADRTKGTLRCFYQHHVHDDLFMLPGLQDITANVDFTYVAESADAADLSIAGYTSQAAFLFATGLIGFTQQKTLSMPDEILQNQAIKKLTLPSEMGELIKFIGLAKCFDLPLSGFSLQDRCREL